MLPFNPLCIRLVSFDFRVKLAKVVESPGATYANYALHNFPTAFTSISQNKNGSQATVNVLARRIDRMFPIAWRLHYGKHPNFFYGTADSREALSTLPTDSRRWWTDFIRLCYVLEVRRVHAERHRAAVEGAPVEPDEETYLEAIAPTRIHSRRKQR